MDKCQKLNACKTGDCKSQATNHMLIIFFILLDQEIKITLSWKIASFLQDVHTYDVKSYAFCFAVTGICGFDQRKAAKIALATVRL